MTKKRVIVLSGVSGSGKSTYAEELTNSNTAITAIVSADNYFMVNGKYEFRQKDLAAAHGTCFRQFIELMQNDINNINLVIVDNTNTTNEEIAPYMLGATAFGWETEIHIIVVMKKDLVNIWKRGKHGIAYGIFVRQNEQFTNRNWPPWWERQWIRAKV